MILPSIGILKAQRRRGEKKNTDFLFTKKIFENQYFFQNLFFENHFRFISHVQCLFILIYKRGQSFQFLSLTFLSSLFSEKILSLFFFHTFLDNTTHLDLQPIFKSRKFFCSFPYHKNRQIQFKKTGSKSFPRKSYPLSSNRVKFIFYISLN